MTRRGVLLGTTLLSLIAGACTTIAPPSARVPSSSPSDFTPSRPGAPSGSVDPSIPASLPSPGVDAPRIGAPYGLAFTGITSQTLGDRSGTVIQELDAANYDVIEGGALVAGEIVGGSRVGAIAVSTAFPGPAGNPYTAQLRDPVTHDPLDISQRVVGRVGVSFVTNPNPEYAVIEAWWWDADHRRWLDVTANRADQLESIVVEMISAAGQPPPGG